MQHPPWLRVGPSRCEGLAEWVGVRGPWSRGYSPGGAPTPGAGRRLPFPAAPHVGIDSPHGADGWSWRIEWVGQPRFRGGVGSSGRVTPCPRHAGGAFHVEHRHGSAGAGGIRGVGPGGPVVDGGVAGCFSVAKPSNPAFGGVGGPGRPWLTGGITATAGGPPTPLSGARWRDVPRGTLVA